MAHPIESLEPVADLDDVRRAQTALRELFVDRQVIDYAVAVVNTARRHPLVTLRPSPRATLALVNMARASAMIEGREYVTPDDVNAVADAALAHRLAAGMKPNSTESPREVVREILRSVSIDASDRPALSDPAIAERRGS